LRSGGPRGEHLPFARSARPVRARLVPPTPMQIRVLGCSGSIAAGCRTTSFLLDDDVLIDAGTGVGDLTLTRWPASTTSWSPTPTWTTCCPSACWPTASPAAARAGRPPVRVHALPATIAALRLHIFNGVIWPDFTRLPDPAHPVLALHRGGGRPGAELGQRRSRCCRRATPCRPWAMPCWRPRGAWVFTGDTGPNPALWQRLASLPVASAGHRDRLPRRRTATGPTQPPPVPSRNCWVNWPSWQQATEVCITHIKPGELDAVMAEVGRAGHAPPHQRAGSGQVMTLADAPRPVTLFVSLGAAGHMASPRVVTHRVGGVNDARTRPKAALIQAGTPPASEGVSLPPPFP
jgi:hypothetical protein